MYCRQCGFNNDQYSKLCHRCGSVLRDIEDHYDTDTRSDREEQEGVLKYARKGDDFISLIKAPFRQLERVTENHRRRFPILITIGLVIAICVAVWLIVLGTNACREEEELVYGNTSANIAHESLSAADESYVYYSCLFGENPGLYRLSLSAEEVLKISYHCMSSLSVSDGWIYGMDITDGTYIRVSSDGLRSQRVLAETHVRQPMVIGNYIYYIGGDCHLYRASLYTLTRRNYARASMVTDTMMTEYCVYNDVIYFIELTQEDYEKAFTVYRTVTPEPIKDAEGNKVELEPYTVSELVPPVSATDIPEVFGCIRQMTLQGDEEIELLGTPVMRLTAGGGFLFFQSETTAVISATDIDPNAPADMDYEFPSKKCWRLNLEDLKYSTLLEANIADSAMIPTDDGWVYYINVDGDLEKIAFSGGERYSVLTYEQNIDRFCFAGGYVFVLSGFYYCADELIFRL